MKKISLTIFLVVASILALHATSNIEMAMSEFASELPNAVVGVNVMRISDKKVICELNGERALVPASILKSVSTASAMEMLGSRYVFHTRVYLKGEIKKHREFKGNIIIEGGGDPTLESSFFPNYPSFISTLTDSLKNRGIEAINGDIVMRDSIYSSIPVSGEWALGDLAFDYGAGSHGLNFMDNIGQICIDFSGEKGALAKSSPENLNIVVNDYSVIDNSINTSIELYRNYDSNVVNIYGTHNQKDAKYWIACSMPFPSVSLRDSIYKNMVNSGIKFHYKEIKHLDTEYDDSLIVDYISPNLQAISTSLMERSDNMFAQSVLSAIAMKDGKRVATDKAIAKIYDYWKSKGLPMGQMRMVDGSGLSRSNYITPYLISLIISTAQTDLGENVNFSSIFPRAGVSGTVKSLFANSKYKGKIGLKSGSMTGVLCYTGFYPIDNPQYAIAVMVNNFDVSMSQVRGKVETLLINVMDNLELK